MCSDRTLTAPDAATISLRAADWLVQRLSGKKGRRCSVVLSGGSTPLGMFQCLAQPERAARIDWENLHIFWSDERWVPYTDPQSNYGAAYQTLLRHVPIPACNIHPVSTEHSPEYAAKDYARTLQGFYGAPRLDPQHPLFDVVLLGIGSDGHTASLFPDSEALAQNGEWAMAVRPQGQLARVTLTLPVLNSTAALAFLVAGRDKHVAVSRVRAGDTSLPAAHVRPHGDLVWFLDDEAAHGIH